MAALTGDDFVMIPAPLKIVIEENFSINSGLYFVLLTAMTTRQTVAEGNHHYYSDDITVVIMITITIVSKYVADNAAQVTKIRMTSYT
jgi:hypothetical protein